MAAWLQRDVDCGTAGAFGAVFKRVAFGVQPAAFLVPALADHAPVLDEHCADQGVGVHAARAVLGQRERAAHVVFIRMQGHFLHLAKT